MGHAHRRFHRTHGILSIGSETTDAPQALGQEQAKLRKGRLRSTWIENSFCIPLYRSNSPAAERAFNFVDVIENCFSLNSLLRRLRARIGKRLSETGVIERSFARRVGVSPKDGKHSGLIRIRRMRPVHSLQLTPSDSRGSGGLPEWR